jgi:hypothetical protein
MIRSTPRIATGSTYLKAEEEHCASCSSSDCTCAMDYLAVLMVAAVANVEVRCAEKADAV